MQAGETPSFEPPPPRSHGVVMVVVIVLAFAAGLIGYVMTGRQRTDAPRHVATSVEPSVESRVERAQPAPKVSEAPPPERTETPPPIKRREGRPVPARVPAAEPAPAPEPALTTTTIYLCKDYSGATFWSNASCHTQRATIDRMTNVPSSLSFEQQVAIAQRQFDEAAALYRR